MTKLSQAQCQALWTKIDSAKTGSVTQAQAQSYIGDFKSVDANSDGHLSSAEIMSACERGLVHDTATTGLGTGTGMIK